MEFKHYTLSKISNTLFYIFCIFIIVFIWINFTLRNLKKSLICTIIITLTILILTFVFKKFRDSIKNKHQQLASKKRLFDINLLLNNDTDNIPTILEAYNLNNLSTINQNHRIDNTNKIDYFFNFDNQTITNDHLIKNLKSRHHDNIIVFCINNNCNLETTTINIQTITSEEIFQRLTEKSLSIPESIKLVKPAKFGINLILCTALNKSKSKSYFIFGLTLLFMSLYTIYSTYYIVSGSILILLSLYCRFNKFFNKKTCSDTYNINYKSNH